MLMVKGWVKALSEKRRSVHREEGFTLIEIILFLSITGILIITMLGGVTVALNTQRYQDSVLSFKGFVQSQYSALQNVANNRDNDWSCVKGGSPTPNGVSIPRGQTDCLLMGRYMVINGNRLFAADVVGSQTGDSDGANDIQIIKDDYTLSVYPGFVEESTMDWGTEIGCPTVYSDGSSNPSNCPRTFTLLLVRSPSSGIMYSFATAGANENPTSSQLEDMIKQGIAPAGNQGAQTLCINSNQLVTAPNQWLYIRPYAVNSSAVETRAEGTVNGDRTQC